VVPKTNAAEPCGFLTPGEVTLAHSALREEFKDTGVTAAAHVIPSERLAKNHSEMAAPGTAKR
jgi:hypothetical protein